VSCVLTVYVVKQARAKVAPYPRQTSVAAHLNGVPARSYGSMQGPQFNRRPVNRVVVCYRCGARGHMAHQCYKSASTPSPSSAAAAEIRP